MLQPVCEHLTEADSGTTMEYCDDSLAYVLDRENNTIKSEGMSYGMMFALMMDDRQTFDRLWRFAQTRMQGLSTMNGMSHYFAWELYAPDHPEVINPDNIPAVAYGPTNGGRSPAPDGEIYFATALLLAHQKWGQYEVNYSYYNEGRNIAAAMYGERPMFNNGHIVFGLSGTSFDFTDPSYHLAAFFANWAIIIGQDNESYGRAFGEISNISREFLVNATALSPVGLVSEYSDFDGQILPGESVAGAGINHNKFYVDSWRVIQNMSMDYYWIRQDQRTKEAVIKMLMFFHGLRGTVAASYYPNRYELDGTPLSSSSSIGHRAMNAVGALVINPEDTGQNGENLYDIAGQFLQDLWDINTFNVGNYYDQGLYMLALLHVSGTFDLEQNRNCAIAQCDNN